jgi:glucose/arabinose dehydrogenase
MLRQLIHLMKWTATGVLLVAVFALLALSVRWWRGEAEESEGPPPILATMEIPPAPVLSPQQSLETLRVAPGYRVELVAAEPLVEDPVWLDWDDQGRLYVVEMRGYMPNLEGEGEDLASGRIVVLEDRDGDGTMDSSEVFLDGLVLPRSVRVVPQGVLVAEPPNLWLCRDTEPADGNTRCDE